MRKIDPKVDEAIETLNMKDGVTRRRLLEGTGLVSASAAAAALLAACSSSGTTSAAAKNVAGNFRQCRILGGLAGRQDCRHD